MIAVLVPGLSLSALFPIDELARVLVLNARVRNARYLLISLVLARPEQRHEPPLTRQHPIPHRRVHLPDLSLLRNIRLGLALIEPVVLWVVGLIVDLIKVLLLILGCYLPSVEHF